MTFNSISSFTSQRELATLGMFACSLTAFPVASLPSDSLPPIVIDNRSDRGFTKKCGGDTWRGSDNQLPRV